MRKLAALALLAVAACGPAIDPNDTTSMIPPLALEPPPIYSLLGYRQELDLTSAQVSALDSIARVVRDSTSESAEELRRRASENSRNRGMIPITENARPLLDQLRDQHRRAALAVQELLTPEQESTVCRLFAPDRDERERSARDRRADRRRMTRTGADTLGVMPGSAWVWCTQ